MSDEEDRIGVAIATRDRAESLARTLVKLGSLPERPPVVVVDNASSDGTAEMVRREFPWVKLISRTRPGGPETRTDAVRALPTPYVAFSDDDSWWEPGALARAADELDRHEHLGLIAARVLVGGEGRIDPTCLAMRHSPLAWNGRPGPGPRVLGFVACGAIARRRAYLAAGGFRAVGFGGEEALLAIDLTEAGWGLAYVDDVTARHHPSPVRDPSRRRRAELRNEALVAWLRRPLSAALAETGSLLRLAPREGPARAAAGDLLRRASYIMRERRPISPPLERDLRLLAAEGERTARVAG